MKKIRAALASLLLALPACAGVIAPLLCAGSATATLVGSGAACRVYPVLEQAGAVAPYVIFQPIAASPATTHGEAAKNISLPEQAQAKKK